MWSISSRKFQTFKSCSQGIDPSCPRGHTRASPTLPWVYKEEEEVITSTGYTEQRSIPPTVQHWNNSLRGISSPGTTPRARDAALSLSTLPLHWGLLTSITLGGIVCTFCLSRSSCSATQSPPWPSKSPSCWCLWWSCRRPHCICTLTCPWIKLHEHLTLTEVKTSKVLH